MFAGRVYADFQNLDDDNRVRLTSAGTVRDLAEAAITPTEGMRIRLYTDDADDRGRPDPLLADGVVEFDPGEKSWAARVDWGSVRHASDELLALKKRFFDAAVAEAIRALDGGAVLAATMQALCAIDHLGYLRTNDGGAKDFRDVVRTYLVPLNSGYDPDWLWGVRNALVHVHGWSKGGRNGHHARGVVVTSGRPDRHLSPEGADTVLNTESFLADVVAAVWQAFEDFRDEPGTPLTASRELVIFGRSDSPADKPFGDMHEALTHLDWVPLRREWLAAEIRKRLARHPLPPVDRLGA